MTYFSFVEYDIDRRGNSENRKYKNYATIALKQIDKTYPDVQKNHCRDKVLKL